MSIYLLEARCALTVGDAKKNLLPLQKGDVEKTASNINKISNHYGFFPKTSLEEGIKNFINWYKNYY